MKGKDQKEIQNPNAGFRISGKAIIFIVGSLSSHLLLNFQLTSFLSSVFLGYEYDHRENCVVVRGKKRSDDYCRPLANCKLLCSDMTKVDELKDIESELFLEKYAYSGRPLVVRGSASNWTAMKSLSFEYFRDLYKRLESPTLYGDECQFFAWSSEFRNLYHALSIPEARYKLIGNYTPWYFGWANCDEKASVELRTNYERPRFLPHFSRSGKKDWFFLGSPGVGAPSHLDNVGLPSWQAQISGEKKWTLKPPQECARMCERGYDVVQRPGDIIVLDTNAWYHSTVVLDRGISITITNEYE